MEHREVAALRSKQLSHQQARIAVFLVVKRAIFVTLSCTPEASTLTME
jgi:hypothetical protein